MFGKDKLLYFASVVQALSKPGCTNHHVLLLQPFSLKDTHREKAPSNKTPVFRKSTNMGVWAVGTLSQLFISGS